MNQDNEKLYHILNVHKSATDAEIRESHRRLSRLFHPDKHTETARALADPKFQEIQHAFEVLSDKHKRSIYDTIGEDGLTMKLDVGQRNMTPEELRTFWLNQARQAKVDELDALVQSRGDAAITVDARAMFGERVVIEKHQRLGSPLPIQVARPATWSERYSDVMFRGLTLRHSFSIPFSSKMSELTDSSITFVSHASATKKNVGGAGVTATLRHQVSARTTLEASCPLLAPYTLRTKVVHQYSPEIFVTVDSAVSTFACPPDVTITAGRQITDRGVFFGTLRSGSPWKLGPWGQYGNAASYILGWTRNSTPTDPSGYTLELITGTQVVGIAGDYNLEVNGIKTKAGASITTNGLAMNLGASRKVSENIRLGANVQSNGQTLILKLTFSRLGQNLKLPIWIADGYEPDAIIYGVLVPLAGLAAFEYFFVTPRQKAAKATRLAKQRDELKDRLAQQEQSARESVQVIEDTIRRRQEVAKREGGLYIDSASYGTDTTRIDVTIALSAFINENQLILSRNVRKRSLTGFWDPCYGESKTLRVSYFFKGEKHAVEVSDTQGLAIPSKSHAESP